MIGLLASALLAANTPVGDSGEHFHLWSCAMAEGSLLESRSAADRFLLAYYFPEPSGGQSWPFQFQEDDERLINYPEGYTFYPEPEGSMTRLVRVAEGSDRLIGHTMSFVESTGPSGDTTLVFKNADSIVFRIDTGPLVRKDGNEFAATFAYLTFYPWGQSKKTLSGKCGVLVTADPEGALDDIRKARR